MLHLLLAESGPFGIPGWVLGLLGGAATVLIAAFGVMFGPYIRETANKKHGSHTPSKPSVDHAAALSAHAALDDQRFGSVESLIQNGFASLGAAIEQDRDTRRVFETEMRASVGNVRDRLARVEGALGVSSPGNTGQFAALPPDPPAPPPLPPRRPRAITHPESGVAMSAHPKK